MIQKKLGYGLLLSGMGFAAAACGGGGGSPAAGFTSAASLTSAMEAPTGTVKAGTAVGVAQAFQAGTESDTSLGIRQKLQEQSGSGTTACPEGGSVSATYSVNGEVTDISARYNNCGTSGCIANGTLGFFGSTVGEWNGCLSYDLDMVCADASVGSISAAFSGCYDGTGSFVYYVEYEGETFTVTGSYSEGSGTLTISGANGTFTCTYAGDAGTCTGEGSETFTFTAASASEDDEEGADR